MKITYWTTTLLISIFLLWSAYSYLFSKSTIEGITALGFPDFFRVQLAILKILAVIVFLAPFIPIQVKEWGYAGVALFLITAIVAHMAKKDRFAITLVNLLLIIILIVSNIYLHKIKQIS